MYLRALALDPTAIITGVLSSAFRGAAMPSPALESGGTPINVNTTVQSTVSPQISPVFIQQDEPSNSAINAATQQIAPAPQTASMGNGVPTASSVPTPGTPMTGAIPGIDTASGYVPTGTPLFPSSASAPAIPQGAILAALGIVGAAIVLRNRKGGASRRRRK